MKKKNSFAVIGLGRFGMPLAKKLAEAGKEVIGIDMNEERVKEFRDYSEYAFVVKTLTKDVLLEIGIQNCDMVIVCIGNKVETSILVTLNVVNLGVKKVLSKAISEDQGEVLKKIGASVVYPEKDMALRTARKILRESVGEYLSIGKDIEIVEVKVSGKMIHKSIIEMDIRKQFGLNIIALHRKDETITEIDPQELLKEDEIIVLIGKEENVERFVDYYA